MTAKNRHCSASKNSTCRVRKFRRLRMSTIPRVCRPFTRKPTRASMLCYPLSSEKTGCPVLVNTSFNVRGEPIVRTPEDAFRCFMGTELDVLAIGNLYLRKSEQDAALKLDYSGVFEVD